MNTFDSLNAVDGFVVEETPVIEETPAAVRTVRRGRPTHRQKERAFALLAKGVDIKQIESILGLTGRATVRNWQSQFRKKFGVPSKRQARSQVRTQVRTAPTVPAQDPNPRDIEIRELRNVVTALWGVNAKLNAELTILRASAGNAAGPDFGHMDKSQ